MKHIVTYLNDPSEPIMFNHSILGNYYSDTFFGNFTVNTSPHVETNKQFEILHCTQIVETNCNILDGKYTKLVIYVKTNSNEDDNLVKSTMLDSYPNTWTLFFDGFQV